MGCKQLISFNPSNMGKDKGYCLRNVAKGYGIYPSPSPSSSAKNDMERNAAMGTLHRDRNFPKGCAVPVYIDTASPYEHIIVADNGVYWSDGKRLTTLNGLSVIGWGEWCNGYRIVENTVDLTWTKLKSPERYQAALQPTHLWDFNYTNVNDCKSIKEIDKGTEFVAFGKVYNANLGSMYLLNEQDFSNKVTYGYNECDMNRKPNLTWTKLDKQQTYLTALETTHLWDFDYTNVNDCKSIKEYKKGEEINIYGTCYNEQLASVYLLTEQDFNNRVTHGFNECDMEKKPDPTPEDPTVGILQKIIEFIQHIIDLITKKEK